MADDGERMAVQRSEARDDCRIVAEGTVAVQLEEVGTETPDVVERLRAVDVAGELDTLPRAQRLIDFALELPACRREPPELPCHRRSAGAHRTERGDAGV
jgi:hypothetical protein